MDDNAPSLQEHIEQFQARHAHRLARAAIDYLSLGMQLFHSKTRAPQVCLGNLAIAIELMLKAAIARRNLALLFSNLPLELQALLSCPETIKETHLWRSYEVDLRLGDTYRTRDFGECIQIFHVFYPDLRQALNPHLQLVSKYRRICLHYALATFEQYELQRAAFAALTLFLALKDQEPLPPIMAHRLTESDDHFLKSFEEERVNRVRGALTQAKQRAKELAAPAHLPFPEGDWDSYATDCPLCGSTTVLSGETSVGADVDEDGSAHPYLQFHAQDFECRGCGLKLFDEAELHLADITTAYVRPEDPAAWVEPEYDYHEDTDPRQCPGCGDLIVGPQVTQICTNCGFPYGLL